MGTIKISTEKELHQIIDDSEGIIIKMGNDFLYSNIKDCKIQGFYRNFRTLKDLLRSYFIRKDNLIKVKLENRHYYFFNYKTK